MPHRPFIFRIPALVLMLLVLNFLSLSAAPASDLPVTGTELLKNGEFERHINRVRRRERKLP